MSDSLREAEAKSIRKFVQSAADDGYLSGKVLDYGCGKQPYRDIVEAAGGEYHGFDSPEFPANVSGEIIAEHFSSPSTGSKPYVRYDDNFTSILCTQIVQYVPIEQDTDLCDGLQGMLSNFNGWLTHYDPMQDPPRSPIFHGHLVLTYPTNWPEVEVADLHRFTKAGMERLLTEAGFTIIKHDFRHGFRYEGVSFTAGYGVIARA